MFRHLRAVVIGREGQLATALRVRLPLSGIEVVTLARPEIDLVAPDTLSEMIKLKRPDLVINPAAYTAVDQAEDDPETAFAVNAVAAGAIAATAAAIRCPVIHFSTDYVFDGSSTVPYVENDVPAPLGVYGASKLAGEEAVAAANERHVILRTAWLCSPWGHNFVRTMLRLGAEHEVVRVVNDQKGTPAFAADIADAVAVIAARIADRKNDQTLFGVFHLGGLGETTWCGFAREIMDGAKTRGAKTARVMAVTTAEYPTRASRPQYSILSTSKISQIYGIRPPAWKDSLSDCLDSLVGKIENSCNAPSAPVRGAH